MAEVLAEVTEDREVLAEVMEDQGVMGDQEVMEAVLEVLPVPILTSMALLSDPANK